MDDGFHYSPMPNARGGFTTRPVLREQLTEAELDAAVSAKMGLPPEQCAQVFTAYLRELLAQAGHSRWSPGLYDLVRLNPTAGGSKGHSDEFRTAADINAGASLTFAREVIREWQKGLSITSQGLRGLVTPELTSVICQVTERANVYCSGYFIAIHGQHLKLDWHDPAQGVFCLLADGTEIRAEMYAGITRLRLHAQVPASVTGPIRVRVASHINGSIRSAVYATELQQVAAPIPN